MLDHPKALDIAIATRSATEKGLLKEPLPDEIQRLELMPSWLIQHRLLPDIAPGVVVDLLLIDKGTRRQLRKPGEAQQAASIQIVTTTRVLHAILTENLTSSTAIAEGILIVDLKAPVQNRVEKNN